MNIKLRGKSIKYCFHHKPDVFLKKNEKLSGFMSWMTGGYIIQCIGQMLDKA